MTGLADDFVAIQRVAAKVVAKYQAVHYKKADRVDYGPATLLATYGLARVAELDLGIACDHQVDRELANLALSDPAEEPPFALARMGGLAGALRFAQGLYVPGDRNGGALRRHVLALAREQPRSREGLLCRYDDRGEVILAEDLLILCPFLAMAAVALGEVAWHDRAVEHYLGTVALLADPETGLLHPGRIGGAAAPASGYWARASGCAALALVEVLRLLPGEHPGRAALLDRLRGLLERLAAAQAADGLWRQDLLADAAPTETSGSALIAAALMTALARGWVPDDLAPVAGRSWAGLLGRFDLAGNGNIAGSCGEVAPGGTRDHYLAQPQAINPVAAFGPLLLAIAGYYEWRRSLRWRERRPAARRFARPARGDIAAYFATIDAHCESTYNGDGSWGRGERDAPAESFTEIIKETRSEHPLPRATGYCVLGYLAAHRVRGEERYLRRAREGLEWLLREQEPDGSFRLYTRRREGQARHHGCLFETGIAASALLDGYARLGDGRYLAASARAAAWEAAWPTDRNINFNGFAIWHLADHLRLAGDSDLIDATIQKTFQGMMIAQQPHGGWQGHNAWAWYHGINVRAYACLHRALPPEHPFRADLERHLGAAIDYLVGLQRPDGALRSSLSVDRPADLIAEGIVGLLHAARDLGDRAAGDALAGLVGYRISPASGDPDRTFNAEKQLWHRGNAPINLYAVGRCLEDWERSS